MSNQYHAVIWIDHSEAKIYRFSGDETSESSVHCHTSLQRLHHRAGGWEAGGNTPFDTEFFKRIHDALGDPESTVITGPGNAKAGLKTFLERSRPGVAMHVSTVETADDQPAAGAMLELGRSCFAGAP